MGNCTKPSQQQSSTPNKLPSLSLQPGLNIIISCWKQTHNNLFNYNLNENKLKVQIINNLLKKIRLVKLGQEYQALLINDSEFDKIMPPVMIDICEVKEKYSNNNNNNNNNKQLQSLKKSTLTLSSTSKQSKYPTSSYLKSYTFLFNQFPKISKPFWLVIKSLPQKKYLLKQGDIFKLGKIKLRVKQIVYNNTQTRDLNKNIDNELEYKIYDCQANQCEGVEQGQQQNNEYKCRICMDDGEYTNPLIGLCQCSGTSKYTHFLCLRQWFTTQLNLNKLHSVTQLNWKPLYCQFCKTKLPYSIILDQQTYYLVQFPRIKKPYIVLNPVYKQNNQKSKIYYFISFKKNNRMIIGRKSDSDVQICTDATISRKHALIEYVEKQKEGNYNNNNISNSNNTNNNTNNISSNNNKEQRFYLSDNKSKFGTVVLLNTKNQLIINQKLNNIQFQVGGDVITVKYHDKSNQPLPLSQHKQQFDFNIDRTHINQLCEFNQDQQQQQQKNNNNNNNDIQENNNNIGSEYDKQQNSSVMFENNDHAGSNNQMLMK